MLQAVHFVIGLMLAGTHKRTKVNVIIMALNIRKIMVDNVVFDFPEKNTTSEKVQSVTHKIIDPGLLGIGTMRTIMHNTETDTCISQTKNNT